MSRNAYRVLHEHQGESRKVWLEQEALELGIEGRMETCQVDRKGEVHSNQRLWEMEKKENQES